MKINGVYKTMSNPVRDFSMNETIGEYYYAFMALRAYLNDNPPLAGESQMLDYFKEFGITRYPSITRTITNVRFIDAVNIYKRPYKNE